MWWCSSAARKKSGKTSLVDRFINPNKDEKDQPKPTVALDYKFARYASETSASKVLAHIYDLGGDDSNQGLVPIPVSPSNVGNLVCVITLDLSEPHGVVDALERWTSLLRTEVSTSLEALSKASANGGQRVQALAKARQDLYAGHADFNSLRLFPVPLVIFATKFDAAIADIDPEKRKGLVRALRHFAHIYGANLLFTSLKDKSTIKSMQALLRQLLFGVASGKATAEQVDPSKPIFVAAGKDSFQSIGPPSGSASADKALKDLVKGLFPDPQPAQKGVKKTDSEIVGEELLKYSESTVDGMAEQRIEELNQYRKQVERNQRLAGEGVERIITVGG